LLLPLLASLRTHPFVRRGFP